MSTLSLLSAVVEVVSTPNWLSAEVQGFSEKLRMHSIFYFGTAFHRDIFTANTV